MSVRGIDVASYQSATPSTAGLGFVMIKATQGTTYVNPRLAAQTATARSRGLVTGFYHFLEPGNTAAQARWFLDHAPERRGDILACDWEEDGGRYPTCADKDSFIRDVKAYDKTYKVGLYCDLDFWLHHDTTSYAGDFLWIADPSSPAGHPRVQHPWTIHQYGIAQGTDQNVANFPSLDAMKTWAGVPAAKPPAPTLEQRVSSLETRVTALEKR